MAISKRELELHERALQVVLLVPRLEIHVAREVVREEADAELERQDADRVEHVGVVFVREKVFRVGHVAAVNRREKLRVENDGMQVARVFSRGIAAGTHGVADVRMNEARLNRVQVHDAGAFPRFFVDENVRHLRVAVRRAQVQLALFFRVFENRAEIPPGY